MESLGQKIITNGDSNISLAIKKNDENNVFLNIETSTGENEPYMYSSVILPTPVIDRVDVLEQLAATLQEAADNLSKEE